MSFLNPTFIPEKIWYWLRWPFWFVEILIILFVIALIARAPFTLKNERSDLMVLEIAAQKISAEDAVGDNLPPKPSVDEVDATVEGIDANKNNIRDDVELAIFENYPSNIKIRAAQLQYAMALQMYFTKVFSKETLEAVIFQDERGISCVWDTVPLPWATKEGITQELSTKHYIDTNALSDEVESLVFNTKKRKDKRDRVFGKYMGSIGGSGNSSDCDINAYNLSI